MNKTAFELGVAAALYKVAGSIETKVKMIPVKIPPPLPPINRDPVPNYATGSATKPKMKVVKPKSAMAKLTRK